MIAVVERTRICLSCPEKGQQPWSAFYAGKKWEDGSTRWPQSTCKECRKLENAAKCRAYYARKRADPERRAQLQDYWREDSRRRYGITPDRYRKSFIGNHQQLVDAAPVQQAVRDSGLGWTEVAHLARLGSERTIRRMMSNSRMSDRNATAILDALGVSPVEVGL